MAASHTPTLVRSLLTATPRGKFSASGPESVPHSSANCGRRGEGQQLVGWLMHGKNRQGGQAEVVNTWLWARAGLRLLGPLPHRIVCWEFHGCRQIAGWQIRTVSGWSSVAAAPECRCRRRRADSKADSRDRSGPDAPSSAGLYTLNPPPRAQGATSSSSVSDKKRSAIWAGLCGLTVGRPLMPVFLQGVEVEMAVSVLATPLCRLGRTRAQSRPSASRWFKRPTSCATNCRRFAARNLLSFVLGPLSSQIPFSRHSRAGCRQRGSRRVCSM